MCPDREILSAYLDGEVDIRWAKQIQDHLSECEDCSALLNTLRRTRSLLLDAGEIDAEASASRSWTAIEERLQDEEPSFFRRRFQLPAPVAAAAAALILFFGGAFVYNMNPGRGTAPPLASSALFTNEALASQVSAEDMLKILAVLQSAKQVEDAVSFDLPDDSIFTIQGEPQMIRAVDYRKEDK